MSKGSNRRPRLISSAMEDLRWKLLKGEITREEFDVRRVKIEAGKTLTR
jgi:hypothetical protein